MSEAKADRSPRLGRRSLAALGALGIAALLVVGCGRGSNVPVIKPLEKPIVASQPFDFGKGGGRIRRSVSGVGCHKAAKASGVCLVVFDEGVEARLAAILPHSYAPRAEKLKLTEGEEFDAEGVTTSDDFFYVTGSHAMKRSDCAENGASHAVVRFRAAPETGLPALDPSGGLVDRKSVDSLWKAISAHPELGRFAGKCLGTDAPKKAKHLSGEMGLNIEGLGYAEGRLFFGLRGPAEKGRAKIVSVNADDLFDKPADQLKLDVATVDVAYARGIRDMVAVEGGFLLLVGPDDDRRKTEAPFGFVFWDGGQKTRLLADLGLKISKRDKFEGCKDKKPKPEGVALMEESDKRWRVAVLSDSLCDGGPMWFDVPKPK